MKEPKSGSEQLKKRVALVAERLRTFALVEECAGRVLIRKWASELEAALKKEAE